MEYSNSIFLLHLHLLSYFDIRAQPGSNLDRLLYYSSIKIIVLKLVHNMVFAEYKLVTQEAATQTLTIHSGFMLWVGK